MPVKLRQVKQLLGLVDHVERWIPELAEIGSSDLWITIKDGQADDQLDEGSEAEYKEIRRDFRQVVHRWIRHADEGEIVQRIKTIRPGWRRVLRGIVRKEYRGFFHDADFTGFPNDFATPTAAGSGVDSLPELFRKGFDRSPDSGIEIGFSESRRHLLVYDGMAERIRQKVPYIPACLDANSAFFYCR